MQQLRRNKVKGPKSYWKILKMEKNGDVTVVVRKDFGEHQKSLSKEDKVNTSDNCVVGENIVHTLYDLNALNIIHRSI